MALPLEPPLEPQLARAKPELPRGEGWCYEPKYDGFRAIVFVDGDAVTIQSRGGKPLGRYFPELVFSGGRYVVDGEIVIDDDSDPAHPGQDFDALQQRIHPAQSRIAMLAAQTPRALSPSTCSRSTTSRGWTAASQSAATPSSRRPGAGST